MMPFADELRRAIQNAKTRERQLYNNASAHVFHSIRFGSRVTGSPGQPVDSGELLKSWRMRKLANRVTVVQSDAPHADSIEDNKRGATLRSSVGGFHSVKLTRIGWNRIVEYELSRLGNGGSAESRTVGRVPSVRTERPRGAGGRFIRRRRARFVIDGG